MRLSHAFKVPDLISLQRQFTNFFLRSYQISANQISQANISVSRLPTSANAPLQFQLQLAEYRQLQYHSMPKARVSRPVSDFMVAANQLLLVSRSCFTEGITGLVKGVSVDICSQLQQDLYHSRICFDEVKGILLASKGLSISV